MSVKENLQQLKSSLPPHVTLVAVSKTKSPDLIMQAYELGQRDFGENYVQELIQKHELLPKNIHWHFIGHLQTNKVKYIAPFVYLIHGVDSLKLLKEINKQGEKQHRVISCLLQLHIASEETKFGLSEEETENIIEYYKQEKPKNVCIKGFMGMASNTESKELIKKEFSVIRKMGEKNPEFPVLSFGMSSDYTIALNEGSNMLRVGSTIFGERMYTP